MNKENIFGFYNYGKEWLDGYKIIKKESPGETPYISLKYFLLSRAIEIFLKTFLIANGVGYKDLKDKKNYGHNLGNLYGKARQLGIESVCLINKREEKIIEMLNQYYSKKEFEYLNENWHHLPAIKDVENLTCKLDKSILGFSLELLRTKI